MKMIQGTKAQFEEHYAEHKGRPFFDTLVKYVTSGPVVCMVWTGLGVINAGRAILGATKPLESNPGTIRGDFAIDQGRNVCHGSDSVDSSKREIAHWFKKEELVSWKSHSFDWIYEL